MYLEDLGNGFADIDTSESCIFNYPDRPPDTLPPDDPPIDPPTCFPYCEPPVDPPGPAIDPTVPPVDPDPGIYPPDPFIIPKPFNRHYGSTFENISYGPVDPGGYVQQPGDPGTPHKDHVDYIRASISKDGSRLATPDGTGHGFFYNDYKSAFKEYTEHWFDFTQYDPIRYEIKLLGTQLQSKADGTNNVTAVEQNLPAGTKCKFTAEVPGIGAVHNFDDSIFYQRAQSSASVTWNQIKILDLYET